ncbi:MAG: dephospho-CoA kinase [Chlamydiae bacterium]|nr:dephospho-CoA kinase [Chlamydiota bacterium]MBI3277796.1 dephospho-CoA kinase [Chlamydiota bacterium]
MNWVGLTGGIGSGKSTVGQYLKRVGAQVFEADVLAKTVLEEKKIQVKIFHAFGKKILQASGKIDPKKLAEVVFQNRKKLDQLEKIIHPPVIREIKKKIQEERGEKSSIGIFIIPLLFEKHLERFFKKVIVVVCLKKKRIERASRHLKISPQQVLFRMKHQMDSKLQMKKANFIIHNRGTKLELKSETQKVWVELIKIFNIKGEKKYG